ncbi:MAG: hypothetical protein QNJ14_06865 [Woeseiaceae bacterium]|nr:hypothetical protein [Woeseiaceae bacterium]
MLVSTWFIVVFILFWIAGPLTQLLFLVAPSLHHRLGLTEEDALKPEFKWFLIDEQAIAIADMTYLIAGIVFVWLAFLGSDLALPFGIYMCSCYVFVACLAIPRWLMLERHGLSPLPPQQKAFYLSYMGAYCLFGLYGLFHLWSLSLA